MEAERDDNAYDERHRPGLMVEDFVPPDVAGETVGLLTPWPAPKYHDTPSLPVIRVGVLCQVSECQATVSGYPSQRPMSLRYHPTGIWVACHDRRITTWRRNRHSHKALESSER
jgi:hypothetical protein